MYIFILYMSSIGWRKLAWWWANGESSPCMVDWHEVLGLVQRCWGTAGGGWDLCWRWGTSGTTPIHFCPSSVHGHCPRNPGQLLLMSLSCLVEAWCPGAVVVVGWCRHITGMALTTCELGQLWLMTVRKLEKLKEMVTLELTTELQSCQAL